MTMNFLIRPPRKLDDLSQTLKLDQILNHGVKPVITSGRRVEAAFEFIYAKTSA
jgi:hypothetical protein